MLSGLPHHCMISARPSWASRTRSSPPMPSRSSLVSAPRTVSAAAACPKRCATLMRQCQSAREYGCALISERITAASTYRDSSAMRRSSSRSVQSPGRVSTTASKSFARATGEAYCRDHRQPPSSTDEDLLEQEDVEGDDQGGEDRGEDREPARA